MTCVVSHGPAPCAGFCQPAPPASTGETRRTPASAGRSPGLAAAKRFLNRRVGRGTGFLVSIPELSAMTGIKERTLEGMRAEYEPQGVSVDQAGRIARAFDELDPGLGAMFLTVVFGGYGYAAHRVGPGTPDLLGSAARASDYAAEVCRAISPRGPGGAAVTPQEAPALLERLDRAVATMLEARAEVRARVAA